MPYHKKKSQPNESLNTSDELSCLRTSRIKNTSGYFNNSINTSGRTAR